MKKFLFVAFVLAVLCVVAAGCKKGCRDVHCENGGKCQWGGRCDCAGRWGGTFCDSLCPIGFEGTYCTQFSRTKFVRTWNATTSSPSTGVNRHLLFVTNGPIAQQIIISNFNNENYTVIGTMLDYDKFEILPQNATGSYTGQVDGSGYMNGSNLAINLTKQGVNFFANCNK